jgi:hypothetical protein
MKKIKKYFLPALLMLFLSMVAAGNAFGQRDRTPKKRLAIPATARGFIGGESHDSYVVRARRGRTLVVEISWRKDGDNRAEFTVSRGSNFYSASPVKFGRETNGGKTWTGKITQTGNYYIYVVGYPTARYTLRVRYR